MSRTDLNETLLFAQVVDQGGFREAARALGVPRSTVSRKVADLEERLGSRLLQRTTRQVALTESGNRYYQRIRAALDELLDAERMVQDLEAEPSGVLRITAPTTFAVAFLTDLVIAFCARWPKVEVEVDAADRMVDLVGEGFDLAIRGGALTDSSLVARTIGRGEPAVVASPAYLDARGTPTSPDDLDGHDFVLHTGRPRPDAMPFLIDGRERLVTVSSRLRFNHLIMVRNACVAGQGIAMLPRFLVEAAMARGELVEVLRAFSGRPMELHLLYPSARQLSPKVRSFVDFLVEHLPEAPFGSTTESPPGA
jgi:DNA-binding transcriptional LysR family regulator